MSFAKNFIVGKTRSEKRFRCFEFENREDLFEAFVIETQDYSQRDLFDICCMMEYMTQRELNKKNINSNGMLLYERYRGLAVNIMDSDFFEEEKKKLNIKTSLDLCKFGSKLVAIEFRDF